MNAESSPVVGPAATALAAPSTTGAPRPDAPAPAAVDDADTAAFPGPATGPAAGPGATGSGTRRDDDPFPATLADVIHGPARTEDAGRAGSGPRRGTGHGTGSGATPTIRTALAAALGITRISGGRRTAASRGAAAWWNASPTHLVLARRIEPGLAASLTLTAALATPTAARLLGGDVLGVPLEPAAAQTSAQLAVIWFPAAVAALVTLLAAVRLCTVGWLILRGAVLLSTAAAMASLTPSRAPVALVWVLAVAASYPFLLPRAAGRGVVSAAMTALAVPLLAQAARSGAVDPVGTLLGGTSGTGAAGSPASTLTLLGGMAVVASLGSAAAATRSTLRATAHLAIRRTRDAEQASAALDRAATRDDLTGLPNRATLLREAMLELARADVSGGQVGMLVIGLGRIGLGRTGSLREGIGTEAEDEVVRQIGRRLRAARPAGETVARVGEHRFAVMIPGMAADGGAAAARRLAALIEEPVSAGDRLITVTGSIGIAVSGAGLDTAEELVRSAEEAMRSAERGGRTPWAVFDRAMRAHSESQAVLEVQLREAIEQGTIGAAFQVMVPADAVDGPYRPVAVEALARWTRPDGTAVTPQRFLPMAEELGLGGDLGMLVLDRALTAWERWRTESGDSASGDTSGNGSGNGAGGLRVSVNAGPSQLLDPEFAHQVSARLGARGIPPEALMVEISASGYRDGEQARTNLGMLRSLGVEIALDDFGRDGTSLATLRQLPIGTVKLDHRLSVDLGRSDAVVRAVVAMCHELGMRVVAEGIETRTQLEAAQRLGVDAVQGFLIGVPGRAEDALSRTALR